MGRVCTVCGHPDRDSIDAQICGGASLRSIAARARIPASNVRRHALNCIAQRLADAGPVMDGDEVLRSLRETDEQLSAWIAQCEAQDDMRAVGRLVAVRQRGLEIIARAVGLMVERSHHVEEQRASVSVTVDTKGLSPERAQVARGLAWARANHPDLLLAAAQEAQTVEHEEVDDGG